ncbi:MAG: hypothetical protein CMM28_06350 [Rhodospirillaceae bacterium]|nr:hypothetical protein [Rhodospirillaceae bacterium]
MSTLPFRICSLSLFLGSLAPSSTFFSDTMSRTVIHERDGDTIVVGKQAIRLNGIAAPERNEPGGKEATAYMR